MNAPVTSAPVPLTATSRRGKTIGAWSIAAAFAVAAYLLVFRLPFRFPPTERLVSSSYTFGFNNAVAVMMMATLLGVTALLCLWRGSDRSPTRLRFATGEGDGPNARPLPWLLFAVVSLAYAVATWGCYVYFTRATIAPIMWEARHFLHRMRLTAAYGMQPYTDFSAEYGPLLSYPQHYLATFFARFGGTDVQAYFTYHAALDVAGLLGLFYVLSHVAAPRVSRGVAFAVVAAAGFGWWMGLNGALLRYTAPFASLLFVHRTLACLQARGIQGIKWWATMLIVIGAAAALNVGVSPEVGIAFTLGSFGYALLCVWHDPRRWPVMAVTLVALGATVATCKLTLPAEYFGTLLRFSAGANNLPLLPAAHLLLFVATLGLLVPRLLAAGLRRGSGMPDAPIAGAMGGLVIVMMPGALGRCDPPHVLYYGLVASALLMAQLAKVSRRSFAAYVVAYASVFIGLMSVVNLSAFYNINPGTWKNPVATARALARHVKADVAPRDDSYLAVLDKYDKVGVPFATFTGVPAAEDLLFERRKFDPEYFIGSVAVYTEADLARKLADVARQEYLLVDAKWAERGQQTSADRWRGSLRTIRKWFLFPAKLEHKAADLDAGGEISRYIAGHYRQVEPVGTRLAIVRRIASTPAAVTPVPPTTGTPAAAP